MTMTELQLQTIEAAYEAREDLVRRLDAALAANRDVLQRALTEVALHFPENDLFRKRITRIIEPAIEGPGKLMNTPATFVAQDGQRNEDVMVEMVKLDQEQRAEIERLREIAAVAKVGIETFVAENERLRAALDVQEALNQQGQMLLDVNTEVMDAAGSEIERLRALVDEWEDRAHAAEAELAVAREVIEAADETRDVLGPKVEANARLIAAAPELLAACESVIRDADKGYGPDTAKVRAALAKVEGREP